MVFRDGSVRVEAEVLKRTIVEHAKAYRDPLSLLLKWGEVEAALEDAEVQGLDRVREFSLRLAHRCLVPNASIDESVLLMAIESVGWPRVLTTKKPEGYCYYALDPMSYVRAVTGATSCSERAIVVGIRSIGTSLSALVSAALEAKGLQVLRFTVRPNGPVWNRRLALSSEVAAKVHDYLGAHCLVIDEGPGFSGSTFLATGDALTGVGVPEQLVTFVCSHEPDIAGLVATDAARRWERFRVIVAEYRTPETTALDISAGNWRHMKYPREERWPATWPELERRKFLNVHEREVSRFVGYSPYHVPVERCATALGEAGFAPKSKRYEAGYMTQDWLVARPCTRNDTNHAISQVADYLAFRVKHCRMDSDEPDELECMAQTNIRESLGIDPKIRLDVAHPVRADGRMMPHEWLMPPSGRIIKTDGHDHGDDHLFPGPCDIAWDIAGAIIEWSLDNASANALVSRYALLSGDRVRTRLSAYLVAYAAFRVGYVRMALERAQGREHVRLAQLQVYYETELTRLTMKTEFGK